MQGIDDAAGTGPVPVAALFAVRSTAWNDDDSSAGTSASNSRKPISLAAHQGAVRQRAGEFAANLGLPAGISRSVKLAAFLHDEGKRDERFQIMLHQGDRWLTKAAIEPLAKSGMDPADRAVWRRAARESGYPAGMRHEAFSARIAEALLEGAREAYEDADGQIDVDLVVHLVAAHHGCGRPLFPPLIDPRPRQIEVRRPDGALATVSTANSIDWNGPDRFAGLCEKYGYWGLALLETVVRLADIWCSARCEEA